LWRGINYVHFRVNRDERGRRIAAQQNVDLTGGLLDGVKGLGDSVMAIAITATLGLLDRRAGDAVEEFACLPLRLVAL
jgi:hypothetical protein